MPGKRIGDNQRAKHGPTEDRARKPSEDRKKTPDPETEGLSAKDAARLKAWKQ